MSAKKEKADTTRAFVQRVLAKTFKQRVDKETLKEVIAKIDETISLTREKEIVKKRAREKAA